MRFEPGWRFPLLVAFLAVRSLPAPFVMAQGPDRWRDPSPHRTRSVSVEPDVKLEVLDWGGTGRDIILLAGLGNTAHVFDEFAPKLAKGYHVWGITRRGFGISSSPAAGYSADRLADDVLAVMDAFKLTRPVLAGHSIAGEEMSSIGERHPGKVSALIYMEAAYPYAFYDSSQGDFLLDTLELQRKLELLLPGKQAGADLKTVVQELLDKDLPAFQRTLQRTQAMFKGGGPMPMMAQPSDNDRASFQAYGAWHKRELGFAVPESELRQQFLATASGGVGGPRRETTPEETILAGQRKFTHVRVPVLAIFANGGPQADFVEKSVRAAEVIRIADAQHPIFLSHEADVLKAMRSFLTKVK